MKRWFLCLFALIIACGSPITLAATPADQDTAAPAETEVAPNLARTAYSEEPQVVSAAAKEEELRQALSEALQWLAFYARNNKTWTLAGNVVSVASAAQAAGIPVVKMAGGDLEKTVQLLSEGVMIDDPSNPFHRVNFQVELAEGDLPLVVPHLEIVDSNDLSFRPVISGAPTIDFSDIPPAEVLLLAVGTGIVARHAESAKRNAQNLAAVAGAGAAAGLDFVGPAEGSVAKAVDLVVTGDTVTGDSPFAGTFLGVPNLSTTEKEAALRHLEIADGRLTYQPESEVAPGDPFDGKSNAESLELALDYAFAEVARIRKMLRGRQETAATLSGVTD